MSSECEDSSGWLCKRRPSHFEVSEVPEDNRGNWTIGALLIRAGIVFNTHSSGMARVVESGEIAQPANPQRSPMVSLLANSPGSISGKHKEFKDSPPHDAEHVEPLTARTRAGLVDRSGQTTSKSNAPTDRSVETTTRSELAEKIENNKLGGSVRDQLLRQNSIGFSQKGPSLKVEVRLTTPYGETTPLSLETPTLLADLTLSKHRSSGTRSRGQQSVSRTPPRLSERPPKERHTTEASSANPIDTPSKSVTYRKGRTSREPRSTKALNTAAKVKSKVSSIILPIRDNRHDAVKPHISTSGDAKQADDVPRTVTSDKAGSANDVSVQYTATRFTTLDDTSVPLRPDSDALRDGLSSPGKRAGKQSTSSTSSADVEDLPPSEFQNFRGTSFIERPPIPAQSVTQSTNTPKTLAYTEAGNHQHCTIDQFNKKQENTSQPARYTKSDSRTIEPPKATSDIQNFSDFETSRPVYSNRDLRGTDAENTQTSFDSAAKPQNHSRSIIYSPSPTSTGRDSPPDTLNKAPNTPPILAYPPGQLPLPPPLRNERRHFSHQHT
jgi:hypothetical protein